jgi:Uma2 family endonuclease
MAVAALISVEEYLSTSYHPDRDFTDGEVQERNVGERDHSRARREILIYLSSKYPTLRRRLFPEQRVQVNPTRFRVPDICLIAEDAPEEAVIRTAPLLCIEILSRDDRMSAILERVKNYFEMGVPTCWIIDPAARAGWVATPGRLEDAREGVLRAGAVEMPLCEIFE